MQRRQIRLTFEDTIKYQKELLDFARTRRETGWPLTKKEKKEFPNKLAYSLMSRGLKPIYYEIGTTKIYLGSIHTLGLKMLDINGSTTEIQYEGTNYVLKTKILWSLLYNSFLTQFPKALEEAIHMSKELPEREQASGYSFNSDKNLEYE